MDIKTHQVMDPRGGIGFTPVDDPRSYALLSVTHPDGSHDFFNYDSQGRLIETKKDGDSERISFRYLDEGKVQVEDATGRVTHLSFGLGGQLAQVRDADGRIVGFGYDNAFQFDNLSGPGGERYRYSYDAAGNLTGIRDALNLETTFSYEPKFNQLASFTDARGNGIDYRYDQRGNLIAIAYADGSSEDFSYDAVGNVLTATNRRGETVSYRYNAAGQVTSRDYDTTPGFVDFIYRYDTAGNLTQAMDEFGTTSMAYDPATDLLTSIDYPGGRFFTFGHDAAGRRTSRTDQDGNVVQYSYDGIGRLDRMTDGADNLIVDYDYDPAGRLALKTLGNGVFSTYDYDEAGHLIHLINHRPDGSVLSPFHYTYDQSGRRTSMTTNEGTYEYDYDALGQLVGVRHPDGRVVNYDYDESGNRRQVIDNGIVTPYATNNLNQYVTVGDAVYEYDLDGNLISKTENDETTTYTYNIENRLVRVETATGVWEYDYDAFGNRIASTHNGETTHYIIDPTGLGNVAAEVDGNGDLIARYDHGFGLLSRTDADGEEGYYTFSAIGNTSELTDAIGGTLNSYVYDPFGESLGKNEAVANPFEFVGEYGVMNEENGLEFMRARFYSPGEARFFSVDPLSITGSLNLYEYATNNPVTFVDPSGLISKEARLQSFDPDAGSEEHIRQWRQYVRDHQRSIAYNQLKRYQRVVNQNSFLSSLPDIPHSRFSDGPSWSLGLTIGVSGGYSAGWCLGFPASRSLIPTAGPGVCVGISVGISVGWSQGFSLNLVNIPIPANLVWQQSIDVARSHDPNDKLPPSGFGESAYIQSDIPLAYTVRFENQPDATAPAQKVVITDTLDSDLDLDTFELTEIAFADQQITVPPGLDHYEGSLPIQANGNEILVEVTASLDRVTRVLTLTLQAIDPETGWMPDDPLTGLLYPNDETGRGEGSVSYVVLPRADLPSGTEITNRASIVFDFNDPIVTPLVLNTLDAEVPTSQVDPLPATTLETTFTLTWSGQDDTNGSGIAGYAIYASINGGPFALILDDTTTTSLEIQGEAGATYAFYSIATDNVGHVEDAPVVPDAVIILAFPIAVDTGRDQTVDEGELVNLSNAILNYEGDLGALSATIDWGDGPVEEGVLQPTEGGAILLNTHRYADEGTFTVSIIAISENGITDSDSLTITVHNVAPVIIIDTPTVIVDEGQRANNNGTLIEPGIDEVTLTASIGTITHSADGTWSWSMETTDGPDESQTVTLTATDEDGASTSATFELVVQDVAPVLTIHGPTNLESGAPYVLTLLVDDPGNDTIARWTIDWGDGSTQVLSGSIETVTHSYPEVSHSWTITATATDSNGIVAATNALSVSRALPLLESPTESITSPLTFLDPTLAIRLQNLNSNAPVLVAAIVDPTQPTLTSPDQTLDEVLTSLIGGSPDPGGSAESEDLPDEITEILLEWFQENLPWFFSMPPELSEPDTPEKEQEKPDSPPEKKEAQPTPSNEDPETESMDAYFSQQSYPTVQATSARKR